MGGWKSKKDGTHFNTDKVVRSSEPNTEVNIEIDNNSDDFANDVKHEFERRKLLSDNPVLVNQFGDDLTPKRDSYMCLADEKNCKMSFNDYNDLAYHITMVHNPHSHKPEFWRR